MGIEIKRKADASKIPKLNGIPNVYFGEQIFAYSCLIFPVSNEVTQ